MAETAAYRHDIHPSVDRNGCTGAKNRGEIC